MFESLKTMYQEWNVYSKEDMQEFVPYSITAEEYQEIVGEEFPIPDKGVEE